MSDYKVMLKLAIQNICGSIDKLSEDELRDLVESNTFKVFVPLYEREYITTVELSTQHIPISSKIDTINKEITEVENKEDASDIASNNNTKAKQPCPWCKTISCTEVENVPLFTDSGHNFYRCKKCDRMYTVEKQKG
jgi:uncharacterized protein with PIN domain